MYKNQIFLPGLILGAVVFASEGHAQEQQKQEQIIFAPLEITVLGDAVEIDLKRFAGINSGRSVAHWWKKDQLTGVAQNVRIWEYAGEDTPVVFSRNTGQAANVVPGQGTSIRLRNPPAPGREFFVGLRVEDKKTAQFLWVVHGDAASDGPIAVRLSAEQTQPVPNPAELGARTMAIPLSVSWVPARLYPSLSLSPVLKVRYGSLLNGSLYGIGAKGDIWKLLSEEDMRKLLSREDVRKLLSKEDMQKLLSEEDMRKLLSREDMRKLLLDEVTRKFLFDNLVLSRRPDNQTASDIRVENIELDEDKTAYILLNPDQAVAKAEAVTAPGGSGKFFLGFKGYRQVDGRTEPVTIYHGDGEGNPKELNWVPPTFGEYGIKGSVAAKQEIPGKEVAPGEERYKRDVYHFEITGGSPSLDKRPHYKGHNAYLSYKLLLSELARDPESRIEATLGIEGSLSNNSQKIRVLSKKWDWRYYLQLTANTTQQWDPRTAIVAAGHSLVFPKVGGGDLGVVKLGGGMPALKMEFQKPFRLGGASDNGKRLFGEVAWSSPFTFPWLGVSDVKAKLSVKAQSWEFLDGSVNGLDRAGNLEVELLVPTSSKQKDGANTYLSLAYARGRNDAKNFERFEGPRFGIIIK